MAIENPTKYVSIRRLGRFRERLDTRLNGIDAAIGVGTQYEYVDLDLPSGTLWAKMNVGAETELDVGNYYKYGYGTTQYSWDGLPEPWYDGMENPLVSSRDTATQVMGAPWHTPTKAQYEELVANTTVTSEQVTIGDVTRTVYKFTAQNGKYIIFPRTGAYRAGNKEGDTQACLWTATPKDNANAYLLDVSGTTASSVSFYRRYGATIRGVMPKSVLMKLDDKADKTELPEKLSDLTDDLEKADGDDIAALFQGDALPGDASAFTPASTAEIVDMMDEVGELDSVSENDNENE